MTVNGLAIKRVKSEGGITLVESLITASVLVIISMGALSYQYHAARHGRIAEAQITATRTAQLLLEDWKSTGGSRDYDPSGLELGFSEPLQIPSLWSEGQGIGQGNPLHNAVYSITVNGLPMQVMLKWMDVETDIEAKVTLRELAVMVRFVKSGGQNPASALENLSPIILTTYARIDGTSG